MDNLQKEFVEGKITAQQYGMAMNGVEKEIKELEATAGKSNSIMSSFGNTLKTTLTTL